MVSQQYDVWKFIYRPYSSSHKRLFLLYLKPGLSDRTAYRITYATSDGCIVFCAICLNVSDMLFANCLIGESLLLSRPDAFAAIFKFFQKFEPTFSNLSSKQDLSILRYL